MRAMQLSPALWRTCICKNASRNGRDGRGCSSGACLLDARQRRQASEQESRPAVGGDALFGVYAFGGGGSGVSMRDSGGVAVNATTAL